MRTSSTNSRGFTLLEIGIALALLALAFTAALPGLEAITGAKLKTSAGRLSSTMRALYDEAAFSGKTCRIAFNLDDRTYAVECAKGSARVSHEREVVKDGRRYVDAHEEEEKAHKLEELQKDNPFEAQLTAKTDYEKAPGVDKVTLPDGISFDSIWVEHQAEKYTGGDAYLYFFPQGHTEHAIIGLRHKEEVLSLQSSGLTGRVQLTDGVVEVPKS